MTTRRAPSLPKNPCAWNQDATRRIYQVLGAQGSKLPASKHGVFKIDGWTVIVKRGVKSKTKTAAQRIYVDFGGRRVPAGRVQQALCRVGVHRSRKKAARQRGAQGRFTWR